MEIGDKVKVTKLDRDKEMNLWGGYDDVTVFLNQTGRITKHYDKGRTSENFGIEFDDDIAYMTRERTGILFSKEQLEIIN